MVGPDKIIGVSAATLSEAIQAEQDGADYLGVGAMFATSTKTNTRPVTIEQLTQIKQAVQIPWLQSAVYNHPTRQHLQKQALTELQWSPQF